MRTSKMIGWFAIITFCRAMGIAHAQPATQPTPQDLLQRVNDLQSQVKDLRSQLKDVQATTQPGPAVQTDIHQPPSLNAGYSLDKGFYIRTDDGNFLLHPWAFIQGRDAYAYQSVSTSNGHQGQNGLEMPRAKFILDGNVFSRDLTYQLIWATTTNDTTGGPDLQDAWGRYHLPGTIFAFEGGNIRNPVDHEQLLFATKSLGPERSIVNSVLLNGDDIVKGAMLSAGYDTPGSLRGELAFTGGERNVDTTFQGFPSNPATWGLAGRAEWKLFGDWDDYSQFTSLDDKSELLVVGGGTDFTQGGGTSALTHVLDVQYNLPDGLSLYAAYLGRYVSNDGGLPNTNGHPATGAAPFGDTYDATARFTAAYVIQRRFEPFFRYEYLHFDAREFSAPTNNDISDITLGANYYFFGQRVKASFAASYLPQGSPVSSTLGDVLTTHRGQEIILQTQVQLIF
jgi:hypothetical protein